MESLRGNTALVYLQLHSTQISEGRKGGCFGPKTGKHALKAAWEAPRKEPGSRLIQLSL